MLRRVIIYFVHFTRVAFRTEKWQHRKLSDINRNQGAGNRIEKYTLPKIWS